MATTTLSKTSAPTARTTNKQPPVDPFRTVLIDCIISAQGLIHAGNGAMMFMLPTKTSIPGAPTPLDASPEVIRAFGVTHLFLGGLFIQAVYQANRGFMQGSIILRMVVAFILWGNGQKWQLAALIEVGLAFLTVIGLMVAP